jgi:NitT/TauT family transport system permease protein
LLPIVFALLAMLAYGARQMATPYELGHEIPLSSDLSYLPYYLLRTTLRMFMALGASLVFSGVFAVLATRYKAMEKVLIPFLDILQSIPILGFLSITVTGFIALFPGSLLGVECAAIFAIFTSQAWNMAFSLYQSLKTVPAELQEAARVFQLSGWQRFWRLDLPYAMPALLWNMMMSMSGGWFFVVASEAISVSNQSIKLPGIGSYIAMAIEAKDLHAIGWAVGAMLIGVLFYDQFFFRPLLAWADKFRFEEIGGSQEQSSWLLTWLRRTEHLQRAPEIFSYALQRSNAWFKRQHDGTSIRSRSTPSSPLLTRAWDAVVAACVLLAIWQLVHFIHSSVGWAEVGHVFLLGFYTLIRVMVLIALAALIWVPIGIWIGMNPRLSEKIQALAQFLAAFPANLLFPIVVVVIVHFQLSPNIWLSPLMIFGTQWYLLFNVIAGASTIPTELRYAARNLGLRGLLRWRRYLLPAVFPSFVTGAITASGGSWNASIVSEYVSWGNQTLVATGIGSYIAEMTASGDFPRIALGIGVMCIYVMTLNQLLWRRLYKLSEDRMHF